MKSKKEIKTIIKQDLYRYGGLTGRKGFVRALMTPGFRYTYILRKASHSKTYSPMWFVYKVLQKCYNRTG